MVAFRIGYGKLARLRCWHPAFLGLAVPPAVELPLPPGAELTVAERRDLLGYDLRELIEIAPTPGGAAILHRYGLRWQPTPFGGWVIAPFGFTVTADAFRVPLAVRLLDHDFIDRTDFGAGDRTGRLFYLNNFGSPAVPSLDLAPGGLDGAAFTTPADLGDDFPADLTYGADLLGLIDLRLSGLTVAVPPPGELPVEPTFDLHFQPAAS